MSAPKKRMVFSDDAYSDSDYIEEVRKEIAKKNAMDRAGENDEIVSEVDSRLETLLPQYMDGKIERYEIVSDLIKTIENLGGIEPERPVNESALEDWIADNRQEDWSNELDMLKGTLGDSELLVFGSIGRWNGVHSGWDVKSSLDEILRETMKDCADFEIWDENGHLYVQGAHHDGINTVEVRMLTEQGYKFYDEYWMGDGDAPSEDVYRKGQAKLLDTLLNTHDEFYAALPRHAEKCFGCPAEEYEPEESYSPSLNDVAKDCRAASHELQDGNSEQGALTHQGR